MTLATLSNGYTATAQVLGGVAGDIGRLLHTPVSILNGSSGSVTVEAPRSKRLEPVASAHQLEIEVPDFQSNISLPLTEVDRDLGFQSVLLRSAVDSQSSITFKLSGDVSTPNGNFQIRQVGFGFETNSRLATSDFALASMWASFALANQVHLRLRDLDFKLSLKFEEPLREISEMLRRRQIAYRIMVIERATGVLFHLPLNISGEQVEEVALIYHAIVDRTFDWPIAEITAFPTATEERFKQFLLCNQLDSFTLGPDPFVRHLFGKEISLGEGTVTLFDKRIDNFDDVQAELARNDRHIVPIVIRSLSGRGRYQFPQAPRLPSASWDATTQRLIDMEEQLDSRLIERYNALAAATLAGLTDDERAEITVRPETGDAFLIVDRSMENT
jgi:hypothetical protein